MSWKQVEWNGPGQRFFSEADMKAQAIRRRDFVTQAAAGTVATFLSLNGTGDVIAAGAKSLDLKSATSTTFQSAVGQEFKIAGSTAKFVLSKVNILADPNKSKRPRGIRQESFTVVLTAVKGTAMSAGTYTLSNDTLGSFSVYMYPAGQTTSFSSASPLGQAELFLRNAAKNSQVSASKATFEIPFN